MGTENFGSFYWCAKVTKDLSLDGEIYVMADKVLIEPNGTLKFVCNKDHKVNLAIAPGKWLAFFAASMFDGGPVGIEYWKGEIANQFDDFETEPNRGNERSKMTKSIRYDVLKRDGFRCQLCGVNGSESRLVIDHIVPVAKGGKTEMSNLQTLCHDCNAGKRDKQD